MQEMTKNDFINYLSHPEDLNGGSIKDLEKLVQEYPYFQLGRMLYLKNLHNENSIAYEKNLHITSAYAPNGKVLYNLIKKKQAAKERISTEPVKIISTVVVEQQAAAEILPKPEPITVLQEMPISDKGIIATPAVRTEENEWDLLEKEMLREAYRTSMTIGLLEEKSKVSSPKSHPDSYRDQSEQPTLNMKPETAAYSFGDWMKLVNSKGPEVAKRLSHPATVQADSAKPSRASKASIIDSFILDQASKTPQKSKVEFYKAENMAKKSLQDDENFVSETLARIYLKQGNLPKALRSYEILLVKYPEKLHIFAPLLEKIKKLLKEQNAK